jgi:hypothetical protein
MTDYSSELEEILGMRLSDWPDEFAKLNTLITEQVVKELEKANKFQLSGEYGASIRWQDYYADRINQLKREKEVINNIKTKPKEL